MKAVHILTLIFVALLLHSISKDYVRSIWNAAPQGMQRTPQPMERHQYPSQKYPAPSVPRVGRLEERDSQPAHPQDDVYPTTLPVDIQQQYVESVPRPTEYDVGASLVDPMDGGVYNETILDSQDQFKDVISS